MLGKLIGIADGGLENGAAGISWCIHSAYISRLEASTETMPYLNTAKINNLFAAEEYEEKADKESYIAFKNFRFKKIKTRSFQQIDFTGKFSSSDELGLRQLLNFFSTFNYNNFRYDVYMEEYTGATVVVPEGKALMVQQGKLVCGDNKIRMVVDLNKTSDLQQSSVLFENSLAGTVMWAPDMAWTYMMPFYGPNNTVIRRKAFFGNVNQYYLFEALAGKGAFFLGAAAFRSNQLMANPADFEEWAKYAIAIQLTSFSN